MLMDLGAAAQGVGGRCCSEKAWCALCPARRLGACLPKTLDRYGGRSTANVLPGSLPGIAHIYIKKGGA